MSSTATAAAQSPDSLSERFREQGFVVLEDVLTPQEVAALNAEAVRVCRGDLGEINGRFERATERETDDEVLHRYLCIHNPHKFSDVMLDAMRHPDLASVLTRLIGPNVKAMQSMLFIKAEGKPGQAWHQDEYFIPTRDRSLTAAWIALDDATVDNGCLWVLPGSHRPGVIYPDREHDDVRFDCAVELFAFPYEDSDAVPVEVRAGSAVVFNGYLLHRSLPNVSRSYRRALVNHYMSAESLLPWQRPPDGVHMAKADFRDVVMVAGADPYAWKGYEDVVRPSVRPDREGGCGR